MTKLQPPYRSACECGGVQFEVRREPLFNVVCYCEDCQAAGKQIGKSAGGVSILDPDGGSPISSFMSRDFTCVKGEGRITKHQLKDGAPTTRYVASCCNSAMYLKYHKGFWVSTFRSGFIDPLPDLKWRVKTEHRTSDLPYPDNIPRFKSFPLRIYLGLIKARLLRA